jgi:hypothetical protein
VADFFSVLTLAARDHQTCPNDYQDDAHDRRNPLVVMRRDAHMRVADADAVMFGMREGNKKGKHTQHEHYDSNCHQSFQGMPPESELSDTD